MTAWRPAELLPHRPPFLYVDAIDELSPGRRIVARYSVPIDEPVFAGHFPGNPILPGVLQLEALAQAGACALLAHPDHAHRLPLFGGAEGVRFRRSVHPGDELVLTVALERITGRGGWAVARATVDGQTTCDARLLTVLG